MNRKGFVLGLALLLAAGRALAVGSLADVTIYDRASGGILPVHESEGRWYVAGKTGREYEVRIRNNTGGDLLAVVSVDGVNVVTGETAATSQGGYVVGAWQLLNIQGWRKSMNKVASFYFTDHGNAYATLTGRPDDVGVIGVAVFKRKVEQPMEQDGPVYREAPFKDKESSSRQERYDGESKAEAPRSSSNAGAGSAADAAARSGAFTPAPEARPLEKRIGTGHGRGQTSHVRYVSFDRESESPNEVIALNYDTRANLIARGIIREQLREANPFPARFVPDPPRRW